MTPFDKIAWNVRVRNLTVFCNTVNSIKFDFNAKKGIKINIPKIDLTIFRLG